MSGEVKRIDSKDNKKNKNKKIKNAVLFIFGVIIFSLILVVVSLLAK